MRFNADECHTDTHAATGNDAENLRDAQVSALAQAG